MENVLCIKEMNQNSYSDQRSQYCIAVYLFTKENFNEI